MCLPLPGDSRRLQIALAIPEGTRRAHTQLEWLKAVAEDEELALVRSDRRRHVLRVAQLLADNARWPDMPGIPPGEEMTTWPTWAALMESSGLSRSTVADILAWLRGRGYLGTVETGTTETIRAGMLYPLPDPHAGEGNRAAEYVLCVPVPDPVDDPEPAEAHAGSVPLWTDLGPLPGSPEPGISCPAGAREDHPQKTGKTEKLRNNEGFLWKTSITPRTQRDRLRASEALRVADPVLRRLSSRHLRHLLTPWWDAGWTPSDVLYAVNVRADGTAWPYAYAADDIGHVPGWIRHRLSAWLGPDGQPVRSHRQRQAAASARAAEQLAAARAQAEAAHAAAVDGTGHPDIEAVRAELLARATRRGRLAQHTQQRQAMARRRGERGDQLTRYTHHR
jgi:hypothetical protein